MKDELTCPKCSCALTNAVVRCTECGSWTTKARGIRRRGWLLIFLGLLLVVMMGAITLAVAPSMLSPTSASSRFTGTPEQAVLILGLFGLIMVFGFTCIISGIWQIVTGRRNIWIIVVILVLTFLLIVGAAAVRKGLDRTSYRQFPEDVRCSREFG